MVNIWIFVSKNIEILNWLIIAMWKRNKARNNINEILILMIIII